MKITILGAAGGIGQALSLLLKIKLPTNSVLSLYDIAPITIGIAKDLSHIPTAVQVEGYIGKDNITDALENADIVFICAGLARKPGMKRKDLFKINIKIIYDLIFQIAHVSSNAFIGIITNPVNIMTVVAAEILKKEGVYDKNRLFGISTLDVIRANTFVAELKKINPTEIEVRVIGGHSSITILPLLSQVKNINFSDQEISELTQRIQNAGNEIVEAKAGGGSATLSMAQAATRFALSLVNALEGKKNIIECSYVEGDGKYARFFSQPLLLCKNGISERIPIGPLSIFEQNCLHNMLATLKNDITQAEYFVSSQLFN